MLGSKFIYVSNRGPRGLFLLTWINLNPRMDLSNHMPSKLWDEIT